jgi:hypothetical protein
MIQRKIRLNYKGLSSSKNSPLILLAHIKEYINGILSMQNTSADWHKPLFLVQINMHIQETTMKFSSETYRSEAAANK